MATPTLADHIRVARQNFRLVRGQVRTVVNFVRLTVNAFRDLGEARRFERIRRARQYRSYLLDCVQSDSEEASSNLQPVAGSTNGPRPTAVMASDVQGSIDTVTDLMKHDSEVGSEILLVDIQIGILNYNLS